MKPVVQSFLHAQKAAIHAQDFEFFNLAYHCLQSRQSSDCPVNGFGLPDIG